jgi:glycosyltransferase involved in cell wall biosynthesis
MPAELPLSDRPLLSLAMIVKDGEDTLGNCLESALPWVDEVIVVDTGSTDGTMDLARSFGAKVFEFAWVDDFSVARNYGLRHTTGGVVFMARLRRDDQRNHRTRTQAARRGGKRSGGLRL